LNNKSVNQPFILTIVDFTPRQPMYALPHTARSKTATELAVHNELHNLKCCETMVLTYVLLDRPPK